MKDILTRLQFFSSVLPAVLALESSAMNIPGAAKKDILLTSILGVSKLGETFPDPRVAVIAGLIDFIVSALQRAGVFQSGAASEPITAATVGK